MRDARLDIRQEQAFLPFLEPLRGWPLILAQLLLLRRILPSLLSFIIIFQLLVLLVFDYLLIQGGTALAVLVVLSLHLLLVESLNLFELRRYWVVEVVRVAFIIRTVIFLLLPSIIILLLLLLLLLLIAYDSCGKL